MNFDPEVSGIKTQEDEVKDLKSRTEKHNHESILKSPEKLNFFKTLYKRLFKKKVLLNITETLIGCASTLNSRKLAIMNLSAGFIITSTTALLTSFAILITNDYISKMKIRYTKLKD